jgi:hypothetical protein
MNHSETIAEKIIETLIPGSEMRFRTSQSNGEYDFNLIFKNGQSVPLEVTVSTDRSYKETAAAIRSDQKGGSFIQGNLCKKGWYVTPAPNANINKIRERIDSHLAEIEAEGLESFNSHLDGDQSMAVRRIFEELQIVYGIEHKWKKPAQIGIAQPVQETMVHPDNLLKAVELEANKPDILKKLSDKSFHERHLFVFIEHNNFPAWSAMNGESIPERFPSLPDEITHVWAVAKSREPDKYIVWRFSSSKPHFHSDEVNLG